MKQRSTIRPSILAAIAALTLGSLSAGFGYSYPKRYTEKITIVSAGGYCELTGYAAQFPNGGPGFSTNGVPQLKGWIVQDWLTQLPEPPAALTRYAVTFHITLFKDWPSRTRQEQYRFSYAYDPATKRGYIRLPGKGEEHYLENIRILFRGDAFQGHWFAATPDWNAAVAKALLME